MIKTILVATDGSDHAKKALSLASDLGAKYGARLILVHVLLSHANSETLHNLAIRSSLSKKQRDVLDNYEANFQMDVAAGGGDVGFVTAPPPRTLVETIGKQIMDRAEKVAAKAGVKKIDTMLHEGDPAEVILDLTVKHKVDMIVLGSRGLSDFKGLLLGSVSHKISAQADCTCVTVK